MALCSIGLALGIVGVVALVKRALFRRHHMMGGCHGGGPGPRFRGFGGFRGPGGFGGPGGSMWLRALFARLDTTPGQEREIRSALEDFQREAREAKDDMKTTREAVARAISGEAFDEMAIGEASVKADGATGRVKNAFEAALRRIHAVLDGKQRERLASILASGPGAFFSRGGPYRGGPITI